MAAHTPTPWTHDGRGSFVFAEQGQMMVCEMSGWGFLIGNPRHLSHDRAVAVQEANQELIVRAVNAHQRLVDLARTIVSICDSGDVNMAQLALMETSPLVDEARDIIATLTKAEATHGG
jgi:hypothetical protein